MNIGLAFAARLALIVATIGVPTLSTRADTTTTTEVFDVYNSTTIWGDLDALGNIIYTQLDIYDGYNTNAGAGTQLYLSRTVISPEGEFVYTDDSFFGSFFTTEPVFQADEKFKYASLAPVTFEGYPRSYTIQVNWTALGTLTFRSSAFKQASHRHDHDYQVKFEGDTESREALAVGTLNGQPFSEPSLYAILQRYTKLTITKGEQAPYLISHPDYYAPTVELGNKLMRGGEGSVAEATWITQNPDGTSTEIYLSIFDGYGQEYRLRYFFDGIDVYLRRIIRDQDGYYLSYEDGGIYSTEPIFSIATNLDRASLHPVQITICSWWERDEEGNCIAGEQLLVEAEWSGVDKLVKFDRFRFTEVTNCDDIDCWFADYEHNFKIKVIGSGESRSAAATASLNCASLGPSTVDLYGQSAFLFSIKEYAIQYGGIYPFDVFPIQAP